MSFNFGTPKTTGGFTFGTTSSTAAKPAGFSASPAGAAVPPPAFGFGASPAPSFSFGGTKPQQGASPFGSGLSFGSPTTSQAAAPASFSFSAAQPVAAAPGAAPFGFTSPTPATSPPINLAQPAPGAPNLSFGQAQAPASGFSFSPKPAAPTTSLSFGQTPQATPNLSFGQASQPAAGLPQATASLGFGVPASQPAAQPAAPVSSGFSFGSSGGLGLGQNAPTPAAPATGLSFGGTPVSTSSGLSFGQQAATSTPAASTGVSFGLATAPAPVLNFGASANTTASPALVPAPAPTQATPTLGGFALNTTSGGGITFPAAATPASTAAAALPKPATLAPILPTPALAPATSLATAPAVSKPPPSFSAATATNQPQAQTTSTGWLGGLSTPTNAATTTAASLPLSLPLLLPPTASSTPASLTTTTTTTSALAQPTPVTSMNFGQLEESINKWSLELEEQEKVFINQATQVNAWDKLLIANGDKIVTLNETMQAVRAEQQSLDHELDFIVGQQRELEELLMPLEKELGTITITDPDREHTYQLADNMDTQLKQMSEDLKEIIEHLNESNRSEDNNDPIVQIGKILNAQMSLMQWIDTATAQISCKLDQLSSMHNTLRRDNERSFYLTYN